VKNKYCSSGRRWTLWNYWIFKGIWAIYFIRSVFG